jgi:hypothetical protein
MVDGHLVVWCYFHAFAGWITLLACGCLLLHVSYFSWCILVILYGDVLLLMSLGGGVLYGPLLLNVWGGHT